MACCQATKSQHKMPLAGEISSVDKPAEEFFPDLELEKIQNEASELTKQQLEEEHRLITVLENDYRALKDKQTIKNILRLRKQFVHIHGKVGGDRAVDAVIAMKAAQMAQHGLKVCILNLNFQRRLQTHALFIFLKGHLMKETAELEKVRDRVFLRILAKEADDVDRKTLVEELQDIAEEWPLFVITDETCSEIEKIDDVIAEITRNNHTFHFWSSSRFARGTPEVAERFNITVNVSCSAPIRQVMEMLGADDDDDSDLAECGRSPLNRVLFPAQEVDPDLDSLPVGLISHNKTHLEQDVWDCAPCGAVLADYLHDVAGLGKPGLKYSDVFIVGSSEQFEARGSICGLQVSLLKKGIMSDVLLTHHNVKIEDVLKTINKVVVADTISVRGVDKKIVIIIPSPRESAAQERVIKESEEKQERQRKADEEAAQAAATPDHGSDFKTPNPKSGDDELFLYQHPLQSADATSEGSNVQARNSESREEKEDETSDDDLSEDETYLPLIEYPQKQRGLACYQTLLHQAISSLSKADKDMILDIFKDAPKHAVIFHFAEDGFQVHPGLRQLRY